MPLQMVHRGRESSDIEQHRRPEGSPERHLRSPELSDRPHVKFGSRPEIGEWWVCVIGIRGPTG